MYIPAALIKTYKYIVTENNEMLYSTAAVNWTTTTTIEINLWSWHTFGWNFYYNTDIYIYTYIYTLIHNDTGKINIRRTCNQRFYKTVAIFTVLSIFITTTATTSAATITKTFRITHNDYKNIKAVLVGGMKCFMAFNGVIIEFYFFI